MTERRPAHARRHDRPDVHDVDRHVHRRARDLEETTEVQLVAEIYNQASALFGLVVGLAGHDRPRSDVRRRLPGGPAALDREFRQPKPGRAAIFTRRYEHLHALSLESATRPTPTPSQDEVITGTPYQEVLTNFPLGSQILTGLFLNITLSGPNGAPETFQRRYWTGSAPRSGRTAGRRTSRSTPLARPPLPSRIFSPCTRCRA